VIILCNSGEQENHTTGSSHFTMMPGLGHIVPVMDAENVHPGHIDLPASLVELPVAGLPRTDKRRVNTSDTALSIAGFIWVVLGYDTGM
jgi:hypothetical protein